MSQCKFTRILSLVCMVWQNFQPADSAGEIVIVLPLSSTLDIHFNDSMFHSFFNYMLHKFARVEAVFKQTDENGTWHNYNVTEIASSQTIFTGTNIYDCNLGTPANDGSINCTSWLTESSCPKFATTCSSNYTYVISELEVMYFTGSEIRNCSVKCSDKMRTFYYIVEATVTSSVAPSTSVRSSATATSYSTTSSNTVPTKPTTRNSSTMSTFDLISSSPVTATTSTISTSSAIGTSVKITTPTVSPTTITTTVSSKTLSSASTVTLTITPTKTTDSSSSMTTLSASTSTPSTTTTPTSFLSTQPPTLLVLLNVSTPTSSPSEYLTTSTNPALNNSDDNTTTIIISACVTGAAVVALCCIVVAVVCRRNKKKREKKEERSVGAPIETYENKHYPNHSIGENSKHVLNIGDEKNKTPTDLITNETGSASLKDYPTDAQNDDYTILEEDDDNYGTHRHSDFSNIYGYYNNTKIRSTEKNGNLYSNNNTDTNLTGLQNNTYENVDVGVDRNIGTSKSSYQTLNAQKRPDITNSYQQLLPGEQQQQLVLSEQELSPYTLAKPVLEKKTLQIIDVGTLAGDSCNIKGTTEIQPHTIQ